MRWSIELPYDEVPPEHQEATLAARPEDPAAAADPVANFTAQWPPAPVDTRALQILGGEAVHSTPIRCPLKAARPTDTAVAMSAQRRHSGRS